jgi:hypothetical protein
MHLCSPSGNDRMIAISSEKNSQNKSFNIYLSNILIKNNNLGIIKCKTERLGFQTF